jgi:hypothetical protein
MFPFFFYFFFLNNVVKFRLLNNEKKIPFCSVPFCGEIPRHTRGEREREKMEDVNLKLYFFFQLQFEFHFFQRFH